MSELNKRGQFNGSILVARQGVVLYKKGFGKADFQNDINFKSATPCYIASLTKQFTAMAVMILAERKKLSYEDHLSDYFSQFPSYAQKITIRNLLNHTSGITDYFKLPIVHKGLTNQEVMNSLIKLDSLRFTPGDKFEYTNSGYILLAMIVEKVSGMPFHLFLRNNIFLPLHMSRTLVFDESSPAIKSRAKGYNMFEKDNDYDILTQGDGGIFSTVEDLYKWDQSLYSEALVKKETLKDAFVPPTLKDGSKSSYGFGWGVTNQNDTLIYSHAGAYGGFNTFIQRIPESRITIILLTNMEDTKRRDIRNAIMNVLLGKPYSLPKISIAKRIYPVVIKLGVQAGLNLYNSIKSKQDSVFDFDESELNILGYQLLGENKIVEAIEILKQNIKTYPKSSNANESLGEAYMKNNNKEEAIKSFERALELDPKNQDAISMMKQLGKI